MYVIVIFMLVLIVGALGVALLALLRPNPAQPNRMRNALTFRIALSVALFAFLMIAWALGLIEPHGLAP